jgi:hypothetical protein
MQASAAGVEPPPEDHAAADPTAAAPPPPKQPGRVKKGSGEAVEEEEDFLGAAPGQLRRAISNGADHLLFVKVGPLGTRAISRHACPTPCPVLRGGRALTPRCRVLPCGL